MFEPPLLEPDNWDDVERRDDDMAWWIVPNSAYRGKELFDVVSTGGKNYLRPYETPDEPICWQCFNGHVSPCELVFCVNKPYEIRFNGWKDPIWRNHETKTNA